MRLCWVHERWDASSSLAMSAKGVPVAPGERNTQVTSSEHVYDLDMPPSLSLSPHPPCPISAPSRPHLGPIEARTLVHLQLVTLCQVRDVLLWQVPPQRQRAARAPQALWADPYHGKGDFLLAVGPAPGGRGEPTRCRGGCEGCRYSGPYRRVADYGAGHLNASFAGNRND